MSEANVELHRRIVEAVNGRDIETLIACFDPTVEHHPLLSAVGGVTVYRGHNGVRTWFAQLDEPWEELRAEPQTYFDLGGQTLVFLMFHGRGRHSGADVAMPVAQAIGWRNGLAVYSKLYADRADALRDLGVSEDELEPIEP
jgi:ketosteroid isomerase-like protein